jgi:hypothetical protein
MKPLSIGIATLGIIATIGGAPAAAQTLNVGPDLTAAELEQFAADVGSILRLPQLADAATLGNRHFDVSVDYVSSRVDGASVPLSRVVMRYGMNDRADIGVWGGLYPNSNSGAVGLDTKIALLRQGPDWPVSVSIRPSATALVGRSDVFAANAAVDLSVSRRIGPVSPYGGIVASSSVAIERSNQVNLDPATAGASFGYAGVAYRWRALVVSGEIERGDVPSYAFRIGTRF